MIGFANFLLTMTIKAAFISHDFLLLPPSGSFGVTKKAKAGRLGVSGRPLFCPLKMTEPRLAPREPV